MDTTFTEALENALEMQIKVTSFDEMETMVTLFLLLESTEEIKSNYNILGFALSFYNIIEQILCGA
jgi:hypothetical protein